MTLSTGYTPALPDARTSQASRLPVPAMPLVCRDSALTEMQALILRDNARLITLSGAGGAGKSRLAVELGLRLHAIYTNVWFVDLTSVRDTRLVPSAIAQTVGVQDSGDRPLTELLGDALAQDRGLLILDNFEHVLDAAGLVAELLQYCPDLVVIATSREALGLRAEHVCSVDPLPVPDLDQLHDLHQIRRSPAVMLFEQRARARRSGFHVSDDALETVARICARVDGLPLGIELAAAQVGVLPLPVILKRLEARAPLVGAIQRDLPTRHQTLESTVAWGYELLAPAEQRIFRACGVFAGGITAEAVERVCDRSGPDVLGVLAQLAAKSPLHVGDDTLLDEPRFSMFETIRAYAADQLARAGDLPEYRARHAHYFVELAERIRNQMRGGRATASFDRLEREYANFRAVFQWSTETGELELGLRLAAPLFRLWLARGPLTEARTWLEATLPRSRHVPAAVRAAALNAAGGLAGLQLDHKRAEDHFRQSLELWTGLGDAMQQADAHTGLGMVAQVTGNFDEAKREFELAEQVFSALGETGRLARTIGARGRLAREEGDFAEALRLTEQGLGLYESIGDEVGRAHQLTTLGHVRMALGDEPVGAAAFREALALWRSLGNFIELAECLDGVAATWRDRQPRQAVFLLGAAQALREKSGGSVAAVERRRYQELVTEVKRPARRCVRGSMAPGSRPTVGPGDRARAPKRYLGS